MRVVAVLGAGLQGTCVALALARRGVAVRLYDRRPRLIAGASANQEGKLHLGFVYAADPTLETARAMIEGALAFAPAINHLVGAAIDWEPYVSARFRCVVHRDSTRSVDELRRHFAALQSLYDELVEAPARPDLGVSYLGRRPERIWTDASSLEGVESPRAIAAFPTEEAAIEPGFLHRVIERAVRDQPTIALCLGRRVLEVAPRGDGFWIGGETTDTDAEPFRDGVDAVVNCLWEGRRAIDRSLGLDDDGPWSTRVKYGFLFDGVLETPGSCILTHGPFGDVVSWPRLRRVYASWYPACRVALTCGELPRSWESTLDGAHDPDRVNAILTETRAALDPFTPGLRSLPLLRPLAGTIVARGSTDIDRPRSELHRRMGEPPRRHGHYLSLYTGKYTVAPLQALQIVDRLLDG
ncbi:MAG: FAD-dependent oxidoreductase [Acidobacteriota bacterium]